MYAIQTEYIGKTEKRPAKVVAKYGISKVSVPIDETRDIWHTHAAAVVKICRELGKPVNHRGGMFGLGCMYWVSQCESVPVQEPVEAQIEVPAITLAADLQSAPVEAPTGLAEPTKPTRQRRAA